MKWFLLLSICVAFSQSTEHHIYWNVSNILWKQSNPTLNVYLGDRIHIHCPDAKRDLSAWLFKVFQVSDMSYSECILETGGKQQVALCNGNDGNGRTRSTTIQVKTFSATPNALVFKPGRNFWTTTSSGRFGGVDNTMYGLCKTRGMRLEVNVLERIEHSTTPLKPVVTVPSNVVSENEEALPESLSNVNEQQLKAVIELASQGKTGTFKHDDIRSFEHREEENSWRPLGMRYYRYEPDPSVYEHNTNDIKDYEIGEELSRPYPSYLSSSSSSFIGSCLFLYLLLF